MTKAIYKNRVFSFAFFFFLAALIVGCDKRELRWAAVKGDLRDIPALIVSEIKEAGGSVKIKLIPAEPTPQGTLIELMENRADIGYTDAAMTLEAMAKKQIDLEIIGITYRNGYGQPDRLLVMRKGFAVKFPKDPERVLDIHRKAIRRLQENRGESVSLISAWMGTDNKKSEEALLSARWESGLLIEELIKIIEDLRKERKISEAQADALAIGILQKPRL